MYLGECLLQQSLFKRDRRGKNGLVQSGLEALSCEVLDSFDLLVSVVGTLSEAETFRDSGL